MNHLNPLIFYKNQKNKMNYRKLNNNNKKNRKKNI